MKYLDALLRLFNDNEYTHKEDVAIIISEIFEENPDQFQNEEENV